jgi:hypothetical protein
MKLLLLPLLLVGAGAGWFGLHGLHARSADDQKAPCASGDCRVTVQCTGPDTCLVTCYDENDQIVCQREVTCDGPCDKACETRCDKVAEGTKADCSARCTR